MVAEAGLGPAIINLDTLSIRDRNGLFSLTLVSGAVLALIFFAMGPVFRDFYQLPRAQQVVPYVAIALLSFAATIIPTSLLLRDQAFFRIANAGLASELISTTISVALVKLIDPLHALAAKSAISAVVNFFLLYHFSKNTEFGQPKLGKKLSAIKPLMSFSAYQFGFNFINYFARNLDNILVAKFMGAASLGVYDKSYQLMRYPLMLLTFAMTPAIQPVIRKHSDDIKKVEAIHRSFTFKLSLAGATAGLGIFIFADWIVFLMLGPQWSDVTPIIKILAIAIPVQVVLSTSGSFFQAMNRAELLFLSGCLSAIVIVIAIVWGIIRRDLIDLAWALVIAFQINFIQAYYIMYTKVYKENPAIFFVRMVPAALVVLTMAVLA
ncbi:Teichuronic acid biosynthesis protein TuaB [compost metagenome]